MFLLSGKMLMSVFEDYYLLLISMTPLIALTLPRRPALVFNKLSHIQSIHDSDLVMSDKAPPGFQTESKEFALSASLLVLDS